MSEWVCAHVAGGAIYADASTMRIRDTNFTGNTATEHGGAIFALKDTLLQLSRVMLYDNQAGLRGGSVFMGDGFESWSGNVFEANHVRSFDNRAYRGGSFYLRTTEFVCRHSEFRRSRVVNVGGGFENFNGRSSLYNVTFDECSASKCGGAAFVWGGDLWGRMNASFTARFIIVKRCSSEVAGGINLECYRSTEALFAEITDSVFEQNSASRTAGALSYWSSETSWPTDEQKYLVLKDVQFRENTASHHGAAHVDGIATTWNNVTFHGNVARGAVGAVGIGETATPASAEMVGCLFSENVASGSVPSSELDGYGGAIIVKGGSFVSLDRSIVTKNVAAIHGGGIACVISCALALRNTSFTANKATYGGALSSGASATVATHGGVVMSHNHAADGAAIWLGQNSQMEAVYGCRQVTFTIRPSTDDWIDFRPLCDGISDRCPRVRIIAMQGGMSSCCHDDFGEEMVVVVDAELMTNAAASHSVTYCLEPGEYKLSVSNVYSGDLYGNAGARLLVSASAADGEELFADVSDRTSFEIITPLGSSLVLENNKASNDGAGVWVGEDARLLAAGVIVASNRAGRSSGGIHLYKGMFNGRRMTFSDNVAGLDGGQILLKVHTTSPPPIILIPLRFYLLVVVVRGRRSRLFCPSIRARLATREQFCNS